jgi:Zn-dependent protease with chaperone function
MKSKTDLSSHQKLDELVTKWRAIIGVDPIYIIEIIESPDDNGFPAWVDGLSLDNPHPVVHVIINSEWLQKNKYNEEEITEIVIHELLHIVLFDTIIMIDPNYKYEGIKARANELLTMKMTAALMALYRK